MVGAVPEAGEGEFTSLRIDLGARCPRFLAGPPVRGKGLGEERGCRGLPCPVRL